MTVLLFASAREAAGTSSVALDLPAGATVASALERLGHDKPKLRAVLASCRAAVDEDFAAPASPLRDGATLAVLPPVSGG